MKLIIQRSSLDLLNQFIVGGAELWIVYFVVKMKMKYHCFEGEKEGDTFNKLGKKEKKKKQQQQPNTSQNESFQISFWEYQKRWLKVKHKSILISK